MTVQDIKNLTLEELKSYLKNLSINTYHAQQIFSWIYKKHILDFDLMSDLSLDLRSRLKANFYLQGLILVEKLKSYDGTEKYLYKLRSGDLIESVLIPQANRLTGCISTQVGCKFACKFCASGLFKFKRNLSTGEMIDEALSLIINSKNRLNNLVFMGMGEPLDNYDNALKAIYIINAVWGINIGARKITISTCGLIPQIKKLVKEGLQIELSISLHAPDNKTRSLLMPINKKYPVKQLIETCREYVESTNRQITFEYVLIKDINSDLEQAKMLSKILKNLNCKVNLIPYNSISELKLRSPGKMDILLFRDFLLKSGINVTLRRPRGLDIQAACGQLRLRHEGK